MQDPVFGNARLINYCCKHPHPTEKTSPSRRGLSWIGVFCASSAGVLHDLKGMLPGSLACLSICVSLSCSLCISFSLSHPVSHFPPFAHEAHARALVQLVLWPPGMPALN